MEKMKKLDLLCVEPIPDNNFAKIDSVIFHDYRVVKNMLDMESKYVPQFNYFGTIQRDILPFMRKIVTTWMLEICEEQNCEDQVFPLAVNFMDRFLCECNISRSQLQLLGATTLFMASKIRQCHPLQATLLCAYTDHSITTAQIRNWELLVLSKLRWDVYAITGFDYVDHLVERIPWGAENMYIRKHSHTLVAICYTELELMQCVPSLIAVASICAAARGLRVPTSRFILEDLCKLTHCDIMSAEMLINYIERVVDRETQHLVANMPQNRTSCSSADSLSLSPSTSSTLPDKLSAQSDEDSSMEQQPVTPTDIQDIYF